MIDAICEILRVMILCEHTMLYKTAVFVSRSSSSVCTNKYSYVHKTDFYL
jgi:hypothetical protein